MIDFLKKYGVFIVVVMVVVLSLLLGKEPDNNIIIDANTTPTVEVKVDYIFVDVKGEVLNPGVYKLEKGSRLYFLLDQAGGISEIGDTTKINLSKMLFDEDVVIIPSIYDEDVPDLIVSDKEELVNINSATLEELQSLPGVGPSTAQKIIDYRLQVNRFETIEELMNVSGIGEQTFNKLKDLIKV